jgi:hypothetical protein
MKRLKISSKIFSKIFQNCSILSNHLKRHHWLLLAWLDPITQATPNVSTKKFFMFCNLVTNLKKIKTIQFKKIYIVGTLG